jgi:hypothetical protein
MLLGVDTNLFVQKTVEDFYNFYILFGGSAHDLTTKGARALYHVCVPRYSATQIPFFRKRSHLRRPLYSQSLKGGVSHSNFSYIQHD